MHALTPLLLDAAIKATVILIVAALVVAAMRRSSAAARHLVWTLAIVGTLSLPAMSYFLPGLAVLPASPMITLGDEAVPSSADHARPDSDALTDERLSEPDHHVDAGPAAPRTADAAAPRHGHASAPSAATQPPSPRVDDPASASTQVDSDPAAPPTAQADTPRSLWASLLPWLPWIWLGGASFALLPIILGAAALARLKRCSRPITAGSWQSLLTRCQQQIGLTRRVTLRRSSRPIMPMTWGGYLPLPGVVSSATILLPPESDAWSAERRRAVLLHELAHVKRCDCLTQTLTQLACALYWFNPLVWVAGQRMLVERERACDDMVLLRDTKPSDYAEHLLEIATGPQAGYFAAHAGIAMARRSKLDGRLVAILDQHRNRRAMSRVGVALVATLIGAVVVPVAMLQGETRLSVEANQEEHRDGPDDQLVQVQLPAIGELALVGVARLNREDEDTVWWSPDGRRRIDPPYGTIDRGFSVPSFEGSQAYQLALRTVGGEAADLGLVVVTEQGRQYDFDVPAYRGPDGAREAVDDIRPVALYADPEPGRVNLRFGVATGQWTTGFIVPGTDGARGMGLGRDTPYGLILSTPGVDRRGRVYFDLSHNTPTHQLRAICTLTEGEPVVPSHTDTRYGRINRTRVYFDDLDVANIDEVHVQFREYHWVEFRDVSLQPGHETEVEVEVVADPGEARDGAQPGEAFGPVRALTLGDEPAFVSFKRQAVVELDDWDVEGRAGLEHYRELGVDAIFHLEEPVAGLLVMDTIVFPLEPRGLDVFPPQAFVQRLDFLEAATLTPLRADAPNQYLFRTRDGTTGLMRIADMQDDPPELTIEYRLLEVPGPVEPAESRQRDARWQSLGSLLQTVRSQLDLYRIQHDSHPTHWWQLTEKTNRRGTTDPTDGELAWGPYLQSVPRNPFHDARPTADDPIDGHGWAYDPETGTFEAIVNGTPVSPLDLLDASLQPGHETEMEAMAGADGPFRGRLNEDAFVELAGVRRSRPRDDQFSGWWRPDGGRLTARPYDGFSMSVSDGYEFALRLADPQMDVVVRGPEDAEVSDVRPAGQPMEPDAPLRGFVMSGLAADRRAVDFQVGVAHGPWEDVARWRFPFEEPVEGRDALAKRLDVTPPEEQVLAAREGHEVRGLRVRAAHAYEQWDTRVVLIDRQGNVHVAARSRDVSRNRVGGSVDAPVYREYRYAGIALEDLEEMRFQKRSYRWVAFRNVSLQPGHETEVEVEPGEVRDNLPPQPAESQRPSFGPILARTIKNYNQSEANHASFLDLDTGEQPLPEPEQGDQGTPDYTRWVREAGIDLMRHQAAPDDYPLLTHRLLAMPADDDAWDRYSAEELVRYFEDVRDLTPATVGWLDAKGGLPTTYRFKTRAGSMGLLQVTGLAETGINIRYKLVEGGGNEADDGHVQPNDRGAHNDEEPGVATPPGLLAFRIAATPDTVADVDIGEYRRQLAEHGPDAGVDRPWRWFPIADAEAFAEDDEDRARLHSDPARFFAQRRMVGAEHDGRYHLLLANHEPLVLTGIGREDAERRVINVGLAMDQMGRPAISIELDARTGLALQALTRPHLGEPMAIVMDGQVHSAPRLQSSIGSRVQITGRGMDGPAMQRLVERLQGPQPAPPLRGGDVISIHIFELLQSGRDNVESRRINAAGQVRLPHLGVIDAAGRSRDELEEHIAERLHDAGVLRRPSVRVRVWQRHEGEAPFEDPAIEPGERLQLRIYELERAGADWGRLVGVDDHGRIEIPHLGVVAVAGLSTKQAEDRIIERLAEAEVLRNAIVRVTPEAVRHAQRLGVLQLRVELLEYRLRRAEALDEAGRAGLDELTDAQSQLAEARLALAALVGNHHRAVEQLETLVTVQQRRVDRLRMLIEAGRSAPDDVTEAELELRELEERLERRRQAVPANGKAEDQPDARRDAQPPDIRVVAIGRVVDVA